MHFRFSALFQEVGVSWGIHHNLTKILRHKLNALNKNIDLFQKKFPTDFYLDIVYSATGMCTELVIKGPIVHKKDKSVEFVSFIPYIQNMTYEEEVMYVFDQLEIVLGKIFEQYGADFPGIPEVFKEVKAEFLKSKEQYTY